MEPKTTAGTEAKSLREITPGQWKSGIAAWLGWLFDGLDMHLYGLVASTFVMSLLINQALIPTDATPAHELVKEKSGYIQAAFLVGWALGGAFFGRLGDILGRSRSLALTILTYAIFTGLSFFAQTWWQLLIFRFVAALGIGGEWAVGSSLLSETWPKKWRPWIAAVLQTGVNLGVLLACLTTFIMADLPPKWVFLVGILPALMVFWIRRNVPEPEEWHKAKQQSTGPMPGIADLFRGTVRRTTFLTIIVCACGLTAWWAFMFWHAQHLRNMPELAASAQAEFAKLGAVGDAAKWVSGYKQKIVSLAFFFIICSSIVGNFAAAVLARFFGYRRAIAICYFGFFLAMGATFLQARSWESLVYVWFPAIGFFSGVFGLFTMYLPPLFPTLLRTTGAGFCYNIGRIASAAGVVFSGSLASGGDFKKTLLFAACLFVPGMLVALALPEHKDVGG
ncbi:MAG: MFS transporter [Pedosphaera sp.]|nr:MFS transporter [Pedosphaera sp.]